MIFVEILDRRGRVRSRTRARSFPFKIGRGYDCDLILDDPSVCPLHAVVERTDAGGLILRDAGSQNGLAHADSGQRVASIAVEGDTSVQLGRTALRLRRPDFRVPAAIPIAARTSLTHWMLDHWSAAVVFPLLYMGVLLLDAYRQATGEFDPVGAAAEGAWVLLALGGWVGAWALFNRLLRHRTRFIAHLSLTFAVAILLSVLEWTFFWLRFLLEPIEPLQIADLFSTTATLGLLLFGHLTIMSVAGRSLRLGIVGAGFAIVFGLQLLDHFDSEYDWVVTLPYWSRLQPLDPSWLPVESPDAFFARIPRIQQELDELAQAIEAEKAEETTP